MNRLALFFLFSISVFLTSSCAETETKPMTEEVNSNSSAESKTIDVQGHRGCRGLMPENTIPAFKHALSLGVTTLELDVVLTADSLVLVSHEPWFSHEISLKPGGEPIKEEEEANYNIFKMDYNETQKIDVGTINHPRFPGQEKINVSKPLLADVIENAIKFAEKNELERPKFNIEIKSYLEWDGIFTPSDLPFYVETVLSTIKESGLSNHDFNIQSFDFRVLKYIHSNHPDIKLAVLVEPEDADFETNLDALGFTPQIYSPSFEVVNEELLSKCRAKNMKLIPWTVNDISVMEQLIDLEVDGIITDYPNVTLSILRGEFQ
jgi:glycerophosphoryl diester phosphodiesterase